MLLIRLWHTRQHDLFKQLPTVSLFNTLASKFFLKWIISFLSQLLPVTRRRSLFIKRSAPYILLGSSKYIGLVSDLIVSFSYKLSLNSLFLHDCVLAIHYNQLLLILKYCVSSFNFFLSDVQTSTLSTNRPIAFQFKWKYIQITVWWGCHIQILNYGLC